MRLAGLLQKNQTVSAQYVLRFRRAGRSRLGTQREAVLLSRHIKQEGPAASAGPVNNALLRGAAGPVSPDLGLE